LPSEGLQQHEVIGLSVLGFAVAGITALLFFCEQTNAGKVFRAIRKDTLLAQSQASNVSAWKLCPSAEWEQRFARSGTERTAESLGSKLKLR